MTEKKRIFIPTVIDEIKGQLAHGSYMLPWPGIMCNFECEVDPELNVANVKPMADRLLAFLKSDDELMPFYGPLLPGVNYLTRWGAQHVWSVQPGWGKVRTKPTSDGVDLLDATSGGLIDRETGLPVVLRRARN